MRFAIGALPPRTPITRPVQRAMAQVQSPEANITATLGRQGLSFAGMYTWKQYRKILVPG